jgi:hypothetical protein
LIYLGTSLVLNLGGWTDVRRTYLRSKSNRICGDFFVGNIDIEVLRFLTLTPYEATQVLRRVSGEVYIALIQGPRQ